MTFRFNVQVQNDNEWATVGKATSLEYARILAFGMLHTKSPSVRICFGSRTVVTYVAEDVQAVAP